MEAVGITLAVFACWLLVGYALTSTLLARRQAVSNMLLAPSVGMCALELAAHIGLRCDSPVGPASRGIVLGALALTAAVLLIRRPPIPVRRALPFGLILLAAILLTGWPLLRWGGDWVANANEDMSNYCLGATGFRDHGFFSLHPDEYFSGKDLTNEVWFLYGAGAGTRHGGELSLAMTSAIAELPTPFVFMPVILAMNLTLISALGFLMHRLADGRKVALISSAFLVISPLATFGIVQQLFGQVGGLAILVSGAGLFLRPARKLPALGWIKRGVLGSIVAAALMLHYTEVAPFLVVGFGLHVAIGFARGQRDFKQIAVALLAAALAVPLLGSFVLANISFLLLQTAPNRNQHIHEIMCPMFLEAGGCPRLWGLASVNSKVELAPDSPWPVHRLVVAGSFYLLLTLAAGVALAWRRRPVAEILLVMIGVAIFLLRGRAAFSLLKLAMFAQPFILGSVVLGWSRMNPGPWKKAGAVCLLALLPLQISSQQKYVSVSVKSPSAGWETPGATQERLWSQYDHALKTPGVDRFLAPINDPVSRRILGSLARGVTLYSPSSAPEIQAHPLDLEGIPRSNWSVQWHELLNSPRRGYNQGVMIGSPARCTAAIALHDPANPAAVTAIGLESPSWLDRPGSGDYLLEPPQRFSLFNRFHRSAGTRQCRVVPLGEVSNYIFWRPTSRSMSFTSLLDPVESIGLHRLQIDSLSPLETTAASGRYLTFQVLNPGAKVRMLVDCTATRVPIEQDMLPAGVVGEQRVPLPLSGHGASRVISEPVAVQRVGESKYLVLDLGRSPPAFDPIKSPWGSEARPISMYIRDVSLLSEEDYAALVQPVCVKDFPADLFNKGLEFSGCGEDGSVGKQSWFRLSRPQALTPLVVRGRLPTQESGITGTNRLVAKWNEMEVGRWTIGTGEFAFSCPLPPGVGHGKLELEFSESQPLPNTHVQESAQLTYIGFEQ